MHSVAGTWPLGCNADFWTTRVRTEVKPGAMHLSALCRDMELLTQTVLLYSNMNLCFLYSSSRKGRQRSIPWHGEGSIPEMEDPDVDVSATLPSTEDVIRKTEQITKNIQELLRAAQENKHDR